jgi:aminobenzoyl-glutamate utilization protein B
MGRFKAQLEALYYDPLKYDTYLEQLGVQYPQLVEPGSEATTAESQ